MKTDIKKLYIAIASSLLEEAKHFKEESGDCYFHQYISAGETLFTRLWQLDLARPANDPKAKAPVNAGGYDCYWRLIATPSEVPSRLKKLPDRAPQLSELLTTMEMMFCQFDGFYFGKGLFTPEPEQRELAELLANNQYLFRVEAQYVWVKYTTHAMRDLWKWDAETQSFKRKYTAREKEEALLAYLSLHPLIRQEVLQTQGSIEALTELLKCHWNGTEWNVKKYNYWRSAEDRPYYEAVAAELSTLMFGEAKALL